jgi:gluconate 2-dehydrogenase gamma chain
VAFTFDAAALRTFTPQVYTTLGAACERLLPRDQDPGAIDLGVPAYIDQALTSPELAQIRTLLQRALPDLDEKARQRHGGKGFHEIATDDQDALLSELQQGKDHAFDMLLTLTLEGAFGDPKYGGNVGKRGFAMIGFTPDPPMKKASPSPSSSAAPHEHAAAGSASAPASASASARAPASASASTHTHDPK